MKRIYPFLSMFLLTLLIIPINADEVDVTGDWELIVEAPRGEMTQQVKFVQDGDKLSVTMKGPRGEVEGEGSIKDSEIEWSVSRDTPRGTITMTYKGKVSGDEMSGEVQGGRGGSFKWKATRKEEE